MAADPRQFRFLTDRPRLRLVCTVCFEPFADDNSHALIEITAERPTLADVQQAVADHQHGRGPEL